MQLRLGSYVRSQNVQSKSGISSLVLSLEYGRALQFFFLPLDPPPTFKILCPYTRTNVYFPSSYSIYSNMADTITAPAPINPSDPGDGPLLMGVTWALTFLCIMCIGTRFYLRNKISRSIASDDWFMLAAGVRRTSPLSFCVCDECILTRIGLSSNLPSRYIGSVQMGSREG